MKASTETKIRILFQLFAGMAKAEYEDLHNIDTTTNGFITRLNEILEEEGELVNGEKQKV